MTRPHRSAPLRRRAGRMHSAPSGLFRVMDANGRPRRGAFAGVSLAGPRRDPVGSQPRNLQRWAWRRQRRSSEGACRPDLDARRAKAEGRRPKGEAGTAAGRGRWHRRAGAWGGRDDVGEPVPTTRVSVRLMVVRERSSTRAASASERPVRVHRVFLRFSTAGSATRSPAAAPPEFPHEGVDQSQLADVHQQQGHDRARLRCDGDARIRPGGARMQGAGNPALNSLAVPLPAALGFLRPNAPRDPSVPRF